jgi:hypothetical protein
MPAVGVGEGAAGVLQAETSRMRLAKKDGRGTRDESERM